LSTALAQDVPLDDLVRSGRNYFEMGRFSMAREQFQLAVALYAYQVDNVMLARLFTWTALSELKSGDTALAMDHIQLGVAEDTSTVVSMLSGAGVDYGTLNAAVEKPAGTAQRTSPACESLLWVVPTDRLRTCGRTGMGSYSEDGAHLAYVVDTCPSWADDGKMFMVYDGKPDPGYTSIGDPVLSPDGKRCAYWTNFPRVEPGRQPRYRSLVVVDGLPGPECGSVEEPVFSADSRRVAYAAGGDGGHFAVVDGKAGPTFSSIDGNVVFSPDSKHFAYIAGCSQKMSVIVDGQRGPEYRSVRSPVFSLDGKHIAYQAVINGKWSVVLDGEPCDGFGGEVDINRPLVFSPDGQRLAFTASDDSGYYVVVDGQRGHRCYAPTRPIFSPDGMHIAYSANKGYLGNSGPVQVIVDGQPGPEFSDVGSLVFSSDGMHLAYIALRVEQGDEKRLVVVDGNPGPEYAGVGPPVFSPDGSHLAYSAFPRIVGPSFMVLDGKRGPKYQYVGDPVFGPDGTRIAYPAGYNYESRFVVVDGKTGPEFDDVRNLLFSPDGMHYAYVAVRDFRRPEGYVWGKGDAVFKYVVVVDGRIGRKYDRVAEGSFAFQSDGSFMYVAERSDSIFRVRQ